MSKPFKIIVAMLLASALSAGCGDNFYPASYLDDLRVLALVADPLEAGPEDAVDIEPFVYLPEGASLSSQAWSFCPFSLGPTSSYRCAAAECEVQLDAQPDGSTRAEPGRLALQCAAQFLGTPGAPPGIPEDLPDKLDVYFRYQATTDNGTQREAVMRLPLWLEQAPGEINRPPVIASVELDGQQVQTSDTIDPLAEDDTVELRVLIEPSSLDDYQDEAGRLLTEEPIISFYTTAGRFEFDRGAHESITGRTGYRAEEIVEALLTRTSPVPQGDPLDVNDDSEFDAADAAANVNDVNDALP